MFSFIWALFGTKTTVHGGAAVNINIIPIAAKANLKRPTESNQFSVGLSCKTVIIYMEIAAFGPGKQVGSQLSQPCKVNYLVNVII